MNRSKLENCVKLLDLMYSGHRTDGKALAKALGKSKRTVFRCLENIREARRLRAKDQTRLGDKETGRLRDGGRRPQEAGQKSKGIGRKSKAADAGDRVRGRETRAQLRTPLPSEEGRGEGNRHKYLSRLIHCDALLELEYSGYRGDVHELAKLLGTSEPTIFRELHLIEQVAGHTLMLVRRRRIRTKS